MADNKTSTSQ